HTGQRVRVGPSLYRERPLAGCRLSRETILVGLPVRWPWSPSLPACCARVGPPFDGLPVLRDHPIPLVSSSSRRWFLDDYRAPRAASRPRLPRPAPVKSWQSAASAELALAADASPCTWSLL